MYDTLARDLAGTWAAVADFREVRCANDYRDFMLKYHDVDAAIHRILRYDFFEIPMVEDELFEIIHEPISIDLIAQITPHIKVLVRSWLKTRD